MSNKPILIIQMQRMGDMIMTYPLLELLGNYYPTSTLIVVGEPIFFNELIKITPSNIMFFAYSESDALLNTPFELVINLSHRQEASILAGKVKSNQVFGCYTDKQGHLRVAGDWQKYRLSITHNNHYNHFHWSDLNLLDIFKIDGSNTLKWSSKSARYSNSNKIGIFVGASEESKRPDAYFWATLAKYLLKTGARPVFLGGTGERDLASEASTLFGDHAVNLTGKFSLSELALFYKELSLLISPDTGPMHLANIVGTPVLNISAGPVNAWETGPYSPGHFIARPKIDCIGCWECTQDERYSCKNKITPISIAKTALDIVNSNGQPNEVKGYADYSILYTSRDKYDLYDLTQNNSCSGMIKDEIRYNLSLFWKFFFLTHLGSGIIKKETFKNKVVSNSMRILINKIVLLDEGKRNLRNMLSECEVMLLNMSKALSMANISPISNHNYWYSTSTLLRPLSSFLQVLMENDDFSKNSIIESISMYEVLLETLKGN